MEDPRIKACTFKSSEVELLVRQNKKLDTPENIKKQIGAEEDVNRTVRLLMGYKKQEYDESGPSIVHHKCF